MNYFLLSLISLGLFASNLHADAIHESPDAFEGTDTQRIQQAVDAAAKSGKRVLIPRHNKATNTDIWLLDAAILLPSNTTVELDGAHLKLSDRCRDNFFRSANCGLGIEKIAPLENIHLIGRNGATLEGADHPRATGDGGKILGKHSYGTDAGVEGESQNSDWRSIGVLFSRVSRFTVQGLHIIDSHAWAISMEYCTQGILRDLSFASRGSKLIDGKKERILNQDGIDLRRGCSDILIENISGYTGDDLVALTALPSPRGLAGQLATTMVSGNEETDFPGIRNIIIRKVHGYCAGGPSIVRLLNKGGLEMENILIDGIVDTSPEGVRSRCALRIGDRSYGEMNRPESTRRILVSNILSRARYTVLIQGALSDSSLSHLRQENDENDLVSFDLDDPGLVINLTLHNAGETKDTKPKREAKSGDQ